MLASVLVQNLKENVLDSLMLMLTGMVGIFVVMGVLLGAIAVLNRVTRNRSGVEGDDDKPQP